MRSGWWAVVVSTAAIGVGVGLGIGLAYYRVGRAYDPVVLVHGSKANRELPASDQPRPKLLIEETEYHFGVMDDDATRRHPFVVRNVGQGVLKLTPGTTTCRCTLLELQQTEIPPGGSTEVVIEWNTKHQAGPYRQTATIHTNDPDHPEVVLTISGEVQSALKVSPPELVFRDVRVGESVRGEAKIFSYIAQDFQIISHQWDNTQTNQKIHPFEVSLSPLSSDQLQQGASESSRIQPRSGVLITLRSEPFSTQGTFSQKLVLKTNQPDNPQVEILVEATVVSDISIFGSGWNEKNGILSFLPIRRGQEAERKLTLACRGPLSKEVRYQIVSVEPKILQVELGPATLLSDTQASLTPLIVRIPRNAEPAAYLGGDQYPLGRILLSTTHPKVPQLEIKVRFAVEP